MSDGIGIGEVGGAIGALTGSGALVIALVKWLGGRVVDREDADKKALQAELVESKKTERTIERQLFGLERDIGGLREALTNIGRQFEARATAQDKEIAELRMEFKEQMQQMEHRLKQDMQRIASSPPRRKT